MRIFILLLFVPMAFLQFPSLKAQDFCTGARSRALGSTGVADTTAWALFNNPAGISHISGCRFLISDEYLYGLPQVRSFSAGILLPLKKKYVAGISIQRQGYEWFNDHQLGLHVMHAIGLYQVSCSFSIWQRAAGDHFREIHPLLNIGGIMSVNKSLQLGLHFSNISNTQNTSHSLPVELKAGILYKISKEVLIYSDLIKKSNEYLHVHTGLEYRIHSHFYLRIGFINKPSKISAGIGFQVRRYTIDYSLSWQEPLGYRHQLSVSFTLFQKL